jgi:peroxiredoxin
MKTTLWFATLLFLVSACANKSKEIPGFNPHQKTTIQFNYSNVTEPLYYTFFYNHTLPNKQVAEKITITSDTTFTKQYDINHPIVLVAFSKKDDFECLALPNDTLSIEIKIEKDGKPNKKIIFQGTTASVSDYLTNFKKYFVGAPRKDEKPQYFYQKVDSFYQREIVVLDSVIKKNDFPVWFYPYQRKYIEYQKNHNKLLHYPQRYWFYENFVPAKERINPSVNLKDVKYFWLDEAAYMLDNFHDAKYDTLLVPGLVDNALLMKYSQNKINHLKEKLPAEALSYHTASSLSSLLTRKDIFRLSLNDFQTFKRDIEKLINQNRYLITDSSHLFVLEEEKLKTYQEYENLIALSQGAKAPEFILKDINGKKQKLSDFRGKAIFLNFWATYCGGCIKSIPDKNELCEKFKDEEFVLINVCLDSDKNGWKNIVEKNNFSGIHLICNDNQREYLSTRYNIFTVAHYTIVDKNGVVVKNGIRDDVSKTIEELL